jgi:hypothetical protein
MAKSLQEINTAFYEKCQDEQSLEKDNPSEEWQEESGQKEDEQKEDEQIAVVRKPMKVLIISDIIFYFSFFGSGLSAFCLLRGERSEYTGSIYQILNEYRGVVLVGFSVLIIASFIMRFIGNSKQTIN